MKVVWKLRKGETEAVSFSFWYEKDNQEIFPPPLLYPPPREAIKEQVEKAREDIDTGDHVFHAPSREMWVVAIVRDDEVWYCGWPCGFGMRKDCYLIRKASPARKEEVFQDLLRLKHDERGALARHQYALEDSDSALHY